MKKKKLTDLQLVRSNQIEALDYLIIIIVTLYPIFYYLLQYKLPLSGNLDSNNVILANIISSMIMHLLLMYGRLCFLSFKPFVMLFSIFFACLALIVSFLNPVEVFLRLNSMKVEAIVIYFLLHLVNHFTANFFKIANTLDKIGEQ